MAFLGQIISNEGVEVDPIKTEAVKNWPRPLAPANMRSSWILGVIIEGVFDCFTSISSPLTTLT